MDGNDILSTSDVGRLCRVTRQMVLTWVNTGRLIPLGKLGGRQGSYVFLRSDVEPIYAERVREAEQALDELRNQAS